MITDSGNLRYAIVLAAGEGERLRPFIRQLRSDALPKQYVNFVGGRSMLEHTFSRVERMIAPERLFTVVSRDHLRHAKVRQQLSNRPSGTIVLQPENKETGPGILLPLAHLCRRHADPVVAVFPSDHFVLEEALFMAHVDLAYRVVERYPSYLVLLGVEPDGPEPEYGYILPGPREKVLSPLAIRPVLSFVEKPDPHAARQLISNGGVWNTMVMVFRASTMLELVRQSAPLLYAAFNRILEAVGTRTEARTIEETYRRIAPVNFSRGVLEPISRLDGSRLVVLSVRGVLWSDWGSEQRIMMALGKAGLAANARAARQRRFPGVLDHPSDSATG